MFGKKKRLGKLEMGLEVKRCMECARNLRPCLVEDKPALFHRWVDEDRAILKCNAMVKPERQAQLLSAFREEAILPGYCSVDMLHAVLALVEYPDGSVGKVDPKLVQFLDK